MPQVSVSYETKKMKWAWYLSKAAIHIWHVPKKQVLKASVLLACQKHNLYLHNFRQQKKKNRITHVL